MSIRPILVVAGVGNASGTGGATARVFAKAGYRVALIARNAENLKKTAEEINQTGGEAAAFPIAGYTYPAIESVFSQIKAHAWPTSANSPSEIRAAVWNTGEGIWGNFLDITEADVRKSLDTHVVGAFAFSKQVILAFQKNEIDKTTGKRGVLIFTGATASIRGNVVTSAFAAGKFGVRALSQSLSKEFGKQNIHVAHSIIDGGILTDLSASRRGPDVVKEWRENTNIRLSPESIANSYLYLANQDNSAWTWELDLRPAHEKW